MTDLIEALKPLAAFEKNFYAESPDAQPRIEAYRQKLIRARIHAVQEPSP